jgi:hypothetical protein
MPNLIQLVQGTEQQNKSPTARSGNRTTITHAKPYSVDSVSDLIAFQFHQKHHLMALDGAHEVIAPCPHMPSLIQLVQGIAQFLPTAMIRYMVGSWRDSFSIAIGQSNWSNWPVELDLEELFFHLRAKGNEIGHSLA